MNLSIAAALISSIAGFALAWQLQGHQITKLKLEQADERIAIQRAARATLEANQRQVAAAQTGSAKRNVRVRVDSDRAGNAGNGLRLASATLRTNEVDPATCDSIVAAFDTVVATSSEFIQDVARDADQCHSDLQLIQESWPK